MRVDNPDYAGQPYRPSNGTEAMLFEERFCDCCSKNPDCEIYLNAFLHDTHHRDYPKEWVYDGEGRPTCTAFCDRRIKANGHLHD